MKKTHRISKEVKDQVLSRIKTEGITVPQAAKEHGVSDQTVYNWLGLEADRPTYGAFSRLQRENAELKQLVGEMTLKLSEAQKKK